MSNDTNRRQISYPQLILYAVGIGIVVGFLATAYYFALRFGLELVWHTLPSYIQPSSAVTFQSYVWILTTIGGFLVGLTVQMIPVITTATIVSFFLTTRISLIQAQRHRLEDRG